MAGRLTKIFDADKEAEARNWPQSLLYSEHVEAIESQKVEKLASGKFLVVVDAKMVSGYDLEEKNAGHPAEQKPSEERPKRIIHGQ